MGDRSPIDVRPYAAARFGRLGKIARRCASPDPGDAPGPAGAKGSTSQQMPAAFCPAGPTRLPWDGERAPL